MDYNLTIPEKDEISKVARSKRYSKDDREILYPINNVEKAKIFKLSHSFLVSLASNCPNLVIKNKIETFLKKYDKIIKELLKLLDILEQDFVLHKYIVELKIRNIIIKNDIIISELIAYAFPLGKIIKEFDPDAEVAIS